MSDFEFLIERSYRLPSGAVVDLRGLEEDGDGWLCHYLPSRGSKNGRPKQVSLSSAFLRKYAVLL